MTYQNRPVYYRGGNHPSHKHNEQYDERGGLLPFLAGVLVTTPFIFAAKNQNQNQYPYPYPYPAPPPPAPTYYPMYPANSYPPTPYPYPYR